MRFPAKIEYLLLAAVGVGCAHPASAQFTPINQPNAAYLSSTSSFAITAQDGDILNSLSNAATSLDFSSDVAAWSVPTTWATWGAPPNTESLTPRVLGTQDLTLTLTLSQPVGIFGFEAQPENGFVSPITATFFNGADILGTLNFDLNAIGGARLFAGSSPRLFTSIVINSTDAFGIAQLRVGNAVPEPGQVALLLSGAALTFRLRRKPAL